VLCYLLLLVDYPCFAYTVGTNEFQKLRCFITCLEIIFGAEGGALPMLEELRCSISVGNENVSGLLSGNMPLLENVSYIIDCKGYSSEEVEVTVETLEHAAEDHPNCPAIHIERENYNIYRHIHVLIMHMPSIFMCFCALHRPPLPA
jgi:hypothetical protein